MGYHLSRDIYSILEESLESKEKADKIATAFEEILDSMLEKVKKEIVEKKEYTKIELKDELRNELVTRDIFEEKSNSMNTRFKSIDEQFKHLDFKLNIFIAISLIALTFANPTFVELIKSIFK